MVSLLVIFMYDVLWSLHSAAEMDESDTNDNRLNENDHEKQEEEDEDEGDFSDEDEDEFDEGILCLGLLSLVCCDVDDLELFLARPVFAVGVTVHSLDQHDDHERCTRHSRLW